MLIRFSVENWMSFKEKTEFSMIASMEKQHKTRVPEIKKYKMKVLPIAALYGSNASGKTNFFKALSFAKNMIVRGTRPDEIISRIQRKPEEHGFMPMRNPKLDDAAIATFVEWKKAGLLEK